MKLTRWKRRCWEVVLLGRLTILRTPTMISGWWGDADRIKRRIFLFRGGE